MYLNKNHFEQLVKYLQNYKANFYKNRWKQGCIDINT